MTIFWVLVTIVQSFSISLGVGSSTLAIVNFFVAIADGVIDETERRMMGVVYVILRVAMGLILITTILLLGQMYVAAGLAGLTAFAWGQALALLILYVNAVLMTKRLIPTTLGPAIQAGSWYTLGLLAALQMLGMTGFTLGQFLLGYVAWLILAVGIVNGIMAMLKAKREAGTAG